MTVSPCRAHFSVYNNELYKFLFAVQEDCLQNQRTQIVTIELDIELVDPLVILDKLAEPDELNFYWENKSQGEIFAGMGAIAKFETSGKERFEKAENFIKLCLEKIISYSSSHLPISGPRFFCSFGFFDDNVRDNYPFPPASIFLPRWQVAIKQGRSVLVINTIISRNVNIKKFLQNLWSKIELIYSLNYYQPNNLQSPAIFSRETVTNPNKFKRSVISALEKIKAEKFSKIVLADVLDVSSHNPLNLCQSLYNLRRLHPNCYIFCASNGKGQNFIGASPERLISIHNQQLITDALAGSAPRGKTPAEDAASSDSLLSSEKERREHYLVIDFITQRLSQLGLFPQVLAPRLRQLSNIQHLWTPISAIVPERVHPLKIVAQLHPTPAVAGASPDIACNEIRNFESFERGLYAAPLGWIDSKGNCEFIVGIRSALIDGNRARLYAGAGIVAGSNPDKELAEIQLKLQALLKALV